MNRYIEYFKNNKEVIILIPTLLGGLYQLLNIMILVGLPYVRYFSVSQVIPDGLLISIVIFWFYIATKVLFYAYKQLNGKGINSKEKKSSSFYYFIKSIFICSVGAFLFYSAYVEVNLSAFGIILMRYFGCALGLLFIWIGVFQFILSIDSEKRIKSKFEKLDSDTKDNFYCILILIILVILVKVIHHEIGVINEVFIKVNNFENYASFSKKIQKNYKMKSEPILLYISKDYAFFKIIGKEEKILVVDAKALTEMEKAPDDESKGSSIKTQYLPYQPFFLPIHDDSPTKIESFRQ